MILESSVALLALAAPALVGASGNKHHPTSTFSASSGACATVSASWAAQKAVSPSGKLFPGY